MERIESELFTVTSASYAVLGATSSCTFIGFEMSPKNPYQITDDVGLTVRHEFGHNCCVELTSGETIDVKLQFDDAMSWCPRVPKSLQIVI